MDGVLSFCLVCGDVCGPNEFQCVEHVRARQEAKAERRGTTTQRGYGGRWIELAKRARTKQPFCTDCGTTENLQTDHLPSAWFRFNARLPLRLQDVDVCCAPCNAKRGSSKPGSPRYERWLSENPAPSLGVKW